MSAFSNIDDLLNMYTIFPEFQISFPLWRISAINVKLFVVHQYTHPGQNIWLQKGNWSKIYTPYRNSNIYKLKNQKLDTWFRGCLMWNVSVHFFYIQFGGEFSFNLKIF